MPVETAAGGPFECEYCGARFESTNERAMHWYRDHSAEELTDENRREALKEHARQAEKHEIDVTVPVTIPRESWAWALKDLEVDPDDADPEEFPDRALDLVNPQFDLEVEGRDD